MPTLETRIPLPGDTVWYYDGQTPNATPVPATIFEVLDEGPDPHVTVAPLIGGRTAPIRFGHESCGRAHCRWPAPGQPVGPAPRCGIFAGH